MTRHLTSHLRGRALLGALVPCALACAVLALTPALAAAKSTEFINPNPDALPAPNADNTTPSCPVDAADDFQCNVPQSSWPASDAGNPEDSPGPDYLNSAYWPGEKRPDIEMYAIQSYGYSYRNCSANLVHYCFLVDAEAVGYPVSHTPRVGDLWLAPGECLQLAYEDWRPGALSIPSSARCSDSDHDWYLGYVEKVLPGGGFIQSWGGSDTPADSGLEVTEQSGAQDPYTDFIGFTTRSALHRFDRVDFELDVSGRYVGFYVFGQAPHPVVHVTGRRSFTVRIPNDSRRGVDRLLPRGRYRACMVAGGPGTEFARRTVCRRFTVR